MNSSSKIYLDCTHTYNSGLHTGIQRVVKNIVNNLSSVEEDLGVKIAPIVSDNGRYFVFDRFHSINTKKNSFKTKLKNVYIAVRTCLSRILPKFLNKFLYSPKLNVYLSISIDKLLFAKKHKKQNEIFFRSNDILILMDAIWLHNSHKSMKRLKDKQVRIIAVVYDLIPVTHPQYCSVDLTSFLKDWYENAVKYVDGYMAISKSVQESAYNYIYHNVDQRINDKKFDFFYLGAEFQNAKMIQDVDASIRKVFEHENVFLSVSTLEPRKNYTYILDTFDKLLENGKDIHYVIIGKVGWDVGELLNRIHSHKEFEKRLFLFSNISDTELIYAYKNAKALIFASHIEGFGLPIIESLFYQLPVLVSDIPVHREIAKDKVNYFDLTDPNSLFTLIEENKIKTVEDFSWMSWQDSAKQLIIKSKAFNINE